MYENEMIEYLDGFSKRMELTACIASIIKRKNTNRELENLFADYEMDNIIFSVLIHIMERTLTEDKECTLDDIEAFISKILIVYKRVLNGNLLRELTRYIVKDILQNKGESFSYNVMDYSDNQMKVQNVRLITDQINENNEIIYLLTSQGYNMLFRTKEVDDKLGFQIEEIRLKMLISKKNYSEAASQSKNLIQMIIGKQNEIRLFERRMLNDLNQISGEEYENIILSINSMLEDEYSVMEEIEKTVDLAQKHLTEEINLTNKTDSEIISAQENIAEIKNNIDTILKYQRLLLTNSKKLGDLYSEVLRNAISSHRIRCFDMEDKILKPLEKLNTLQANEISEISAKLLGPLFIPSFPTLLNIGLFYEPQSKQNEELSSQNIIDEELQSDDYIKQRIEKRNKTHTKCIKLLLKLLSDKPSGFTLDEFFEYSKDNCNIDALTDEKLFFLVNLKLYEIGLIDIELWKRESNVPDNCQGEFDLSYSLGMIRNENEEMYGIKKIIIDKIPEKIELKWISKDYGEHLLKCEHCVEMHNLKFYAEV